MFLDFLHIYPVSKLRNRLSVQVMSKTWWRMAISGDAFGKQRPLIPWKKEKALQRKEACERRLKEADGGQRLTSLYPQQVCR